MRSVVLALAVMCSAMPAIAAPRNKAAAEAAYAQGQKSYAAGDFRAAAQRFQAAYELDPDPVYLFNAGQALRFGKSCSASAELYRKFIAAAPEARNRAKVEGYIAEMERCAKATPTSGDPKPDVTPTDPGPHVVGAPDPIGGAALPVGPTPAEPPRAGSRSWLGLGIAGFGAVSVGVGIYEHIQNNHYEDKRAHVCDGIPTCVWKDVKAAADGYDASGRTASRIAISAYAVGSVALAGGILLYVMSGSSRETPSLAIAPTGDGAMVLSAFSF